MSSSFGSRNVFSSSLDLSDILDRVALISSLSRRESSSILFGVILGDISDCEPLTMCITAYSFPDISFYSDKKLKRRIEVTII